MKRSCTAWRTSGIIVKQHLKKRGEGKRKSCIVCRTSVITQRRNGKQYCTMKLSKNMSRKRSSKLRSTVLGINSIAKKSSGIVRSSRESMRGR